MNVTHTVIREYVDIDVDVDGGVGGEVGYVVCLELWLCVDSSVISVVMFQYLWCIRKP